ncbi:MAG: hypothetical protein WC894_02240 [Patescibacteria group bacterium]
MNDSNRILKIIFFVLLIVTVGELFYFFVYQPSKNNVVKKTSLTAINQLPSPTSIATLPIEDQAFNQDVLNNLLLLRKDIVKSSTIINEYQGTIIEIDLKENPLDGQTNRQLKIRIKSDLGNANSFYYNNDEIDKIKVFNLNNGQKEQYSLDKLIIGDKILVKTSYNLLKNNNNNLIEEEIVKQ